MPLFIGEVGSCRVGELKCLLLREWGSRHHPPGVLRMRVWERVLRVALSTKGVLWRFGLVLRRLVSEHEVGVELAESWSYRLAQR